MSKVIGIRLAPLTPIAVYTDYQHKKLICNAYVEKHTPYSVEYRTDRNTRGKAFISCIEVLFSTAAEEALRKIMANMRKLEAALKANKMKTVRGLTIYHEQLENKLAAIQKDAITTNA